jgi:hypothetical protein
MTLLDAQEIDPVKAQKRKKRIILAIALVVVVFAVGVFGFLRGDGWWFRYLPQELKVSRFFGALQNKDYNTAYGIWMNDPQWQQHPGDHSKYPFNEFYRDWGPGGQWGLIKTQKVYGASGCPGGGSGIVVDVVVNDRSEHAQVWVEKSDNTLSFPPGGPCDLVFR